MRRQFRDVTGGEQMLSNIVPGLGLMNYILGWFTVPAEVFLRRNFGERYYTRANFFAGLILLLIFHFSASIIGMLNPMGWFFGRGGSETSPWMWTIIKWYFWIGIFHFLHMWWNDIMGHPVHSFSAGKSWLRPVGKALMWVMNRFLNLVVHLLVRVLPGYKAERLEDALPVMRDVDTFTERFVEPLFLFIVAMMASAAGQTSVFFWLFFSIMALNFYTGMRHQAERSYVLDIRDQLIESRQLRAVISGVPSDQDSRSSQLQRVIVETAKEAEREPEVMDTIRNQQPSLADAVAAFNARKKRAESNTGLSEDIPAAA